MLGLLGLLAHPRGLPVYGYTALGSSDYIRLILIQPEDDMQPLRLTFKTVKLTEAPDYVALSYTWGGSEKSHQVVVRDPLSRLPITASLHSALKDFRAVSRQLLGGSPYMWADAICINQSDDCEKADQVSQMGHIYRKASMVLTYIGPSTSTSRKGIELAEKLFSWAEKRRSPLSHEKPPASFYKAHGFPLPDDVAWQGLHELMDRPWSSRVWIVQESLLNKKLEMLCGRTFIGRDLFGAIAFFALNSIVPQLATAGCGSGPAALLAQKDLQNFATNEKEFKNEKNFYQLLRLCHLFESNEPRDKVYALLGVTPDRDSLGIVPDYTIPVVELYIKVAVGLLRTYRKLDFFSSVHVEKKVADLPSWVPDWSSYNFGYETFITNPYIVHYDNNCAAAESSANFHLSEDCRLLSLQGIVVDRVSHIDVGEEPRHPLPLFLIEQLDRLTELPMYAPFKDDELAAWKEILRFSRTTSTASTTETLEIGSLELGDREMEILEKFEALLSGNPATMMPADKVDRAQELRDSMRAAFVHTHRNRRFFTTEKGYIGLGPEASRVGDLVCVLLGGPLPYILRRSETSFKLIGESYVHGLMRGEAIHLEGFKVQRLTLI
jgi:hypothetical protein